MPADRHVAFKRLLVELGGEVLATTANPWELMRFRTQFGIGVVYSNRRGQETWNREAQLARDAVQARQKLGRVKPVKASGHAGENEALRQRDGDDCFFCLTPLGTDVTREHLVPRVHGGPNHLSNKFLAHARCNGRAGHLSAPEKIRIREEALRQRWEREEFPTMNGATA